MHAGLSPRDAAAVIDAGWAERHLYAGRRFAGGGRLPAGMVLVYAPRDPAEVAVSLEILRAALAFAESGGP